jgi:hypothetical protein
MQEVGVVGFKKANPTAVEEGRRAAVGCAGPGHPSWLEDRKNTSRFTGSDADKGGAVAAAAATATAAAMEQLADSTARWADAEESDVDADMSGLGGLPAAQGGAGHEAVREAWRAFTLSEGLTLAHVDALREAILRKVATFTAAEGGASSDSTPEVPGSVQGVATAAPRTSRSAVGGLRR